jgi:hypothetical protein
LPILITTWRPGAAAANTPRDCRGVTRRAPGRGVSGASEAMQIA